MHPPLAPAIAKGQGQLPVTALRWGIPQEMCEKDGGEGKEHSSKTGGGAEGKFRESPLVPLLSEQQPLSFCSHTVAGTVRSAVSLTAPAPVVKCPTSNLSRH